MLAEYQKSLAFNGRRSRSELRSSDEKVWKISSSSSLVTLSSAHSRPFLGDESVTTHGFTTGVDTASECEMVVCCYYTLVNSKGSVKAVREADLVVAFALVCFVKSRNRVEVRLISG